MTPLHPPILHPIPAVHHALYLALRTKCQTSDIIEAFIVAADACYEKDENIMGQQCNVNAAFAMFGGYQPNLFIRDKDNEKFISIPIIALNA